jgi:hypothetical protein
MSPKLKILFVVAETWPLVKTGGSPTWRPRSRPR